MVLAATAAAEVQVALGVPSLVGRAATAAVLMVVRGEPVVPPGRVALAVLVLIGPLPGIMEAPRDRGVAAAASQWELAAQAVLTAAAAAAVWPVGPLAAALMVSSSLPTRQFRSPRFTHSMAEAPG